MSEQRSQAAGSLPLAGVKVLDFGHALAGSACSQILARFGAETIKVERPGVGDDLRYYTEHAGLHGMSVPFCSCNAGKLGMTLDLKQPAAKPVFERLVSNADVLIENYRPGVMRSLGADWDSVERINPRIVYCSITGFGQSGELRQRPAYDHIIQAMSGIMSVNGEPHRGPLKVGLPAVDTFSGYFAAVAVLAALRRRDSLGKGEFIDVAMLDAALTLMSSAVATHLYTGELPPRPGNSGFRRVPTSGMFATSDGYLQIGANHQHQVERLLKVLKLEALLEDERFKDHRSRVIHADALLEILALEFAEREAAVLELALAEVQVPAAMVRTVPEILRHPHLGERSLLVEAHIAGTEQPIALMRGVPKLRDSPDDVGDVPALGQHSELVLQNLGFSAAEIAALRNAKAI